MVISINAIPPQDFNNHWTGNGLSGAGNNVRGKVVTDMKLLMKHVDKGEFLVCA